MTQKYNEQSISNDTIPNLHNFYPKTVTNHKRQERENLVDKISEVEEEEL